MPADPWICLFVSFAVATPNPAPRRVLNAATGVPCGSPAPVNAEGGQKELIMKTIYDNVNEIERRLGRDR